MTGECGLNYNNNRVLTRLSRIHFAFGFTDKKCALKIYFLMLKPCKMICLNSDSADCCKQWPVRQFVFFAVTKKLSKLPSGARRFHIVTRQSIQNSSANTISKIIWHSQLLTIGRCCMDSALYLSHCFHGSGNVKVIFFIWMKQP